MTYKDKPLNESDVPSFGKIIAYMFLILFLCIALIIFLDDLWRAISEKRKAIPITYNICFKNNTFKIEIAKTREELSRGLGFRNHLDTDRGMLFVFEGEGIRSFWMKDMRIPLDIIWFDRNGVVLYIAGNMQPCNTILCKSIAPNVNASMVLELNAKTVNRIGLANGDRFDFC